MTLDIQQYKKDFRKLVYKHNRAVRFQEKGKQRYNDQFEYALDEFVDKLTPLTVTCTRCGSSFKQTPYNHLKGLHPCQNCYQTIIHVEPKRQNCLYCCLPLTEK